MSKQKITKKSDRWHVRNRPSMYIGAIDRTKVSDFFLEDDKIEFKTVEYVPGLIKIINEVLDNAVDEAIRTEFKFANQIKLSFNTKDNTIVIEDNGRGIPVEHDEITNEWAPVLCWGEAKAGGNFEDDEERETLGLNGVGAFATNVWSTEFIGETCDGINKLIASFTNNAKEKDVKISKGKKKYTKVMFKPDLDGFGVTLEDFFGTDSIHKKIIYQRLLNLAICYPQIKFYFDNKIVKPGTMKKFLSYFGENFEYVSDENYVIGVFPNETDDFKFYSYMNGLKMSQGGNHIELVTNEVVSKLRDKISKRYKSIKPGDIKNKLMIVYFMWGFPNAKFDSQTKEKLTNSYRDIRSFLGNIDFDTFGKKILKNKEIIDPIIEIYKIKEEFKKRQELAKLKNNSNKKIKNDKYTPPIGSNKYLMLCEGQSAKGGLSAVLGRKGIGYFELRGLPLNAYVSKLLKILQNKECKGLIEILNFDLSVKEQKECSFENIVFGTDADLDGINIRGLLLGLFMRYAKNLIIEGRIHQLKTPIIVFKDKKGKIIHCFFTLAEYQSFIEKNSISKYVLDYKKGLGSWNDEELQQVIDMYSFDELIDTLEYVEGCEEKLDDWLASNKIEKRKEYLTNNKFDIFKA